MQIKVRFGLEISVSKEDTIRMCDYSLMCYENRMGREGEELFTHRFRSGSVGLISKEKPASSGFLSTLVGFFRPAKEVAVCIPPGAQLFLTGIPEGFQLVHGVKANESAVFEQLSAEVNFHRDAIRFQNGKAVSLQELAEGVTVSLLSLESAADRELVMERGNLIPIGSGASRSLASH